MKVTLRILGIPGLSQILGGGEFVFEFTGETVKDLVETLVGQHGEKVKKQLLDSEGKLNRRIKVSINRQEFSPFYRDEMVIKPGDEVTLMILLAGG